MANCLVLLTVLVAVIAETPETLLLGYLALLSLNGIMEFDTRHVHNASTTIAQCMYPRMLYNHCWTALLLLCTYINVSCWVAVHRFHVIWASGIWMTCDHPPLPIRPGETHFSCSSNATAHISIANEKSGRNLRCIGFLLCSRWKIGVVEVDDGLTFHPKSNAYQYIKYIIFNIPFIDNVDISCNIYTAAVWWLYYHMVACMSTFFYCCGCQTLFIRCIRNIYYI